MLWRRFVYYGVDALFLTFIQRLLSPGKSEEENDKIGLSMTTYVKYTTNGDAFKQVRKPDVPLLILQKGRISKTLECLPCKIPSASWEQLDRTDIPQCSHPSV